MLSCYIALIIYAFKHALKNSHDYTHSIITVQTAVKVIICALLVHPSMQQEAKLQEYKLHISSGQLLFCSRVNSNVHTEGIKKQP